MTEIVHVERLVAGHARGFASDTDAQTFGLEDRRSVQVPLLPALGRFRHVCRKPQKPARYQSGGEPN
jgi:hypothetical protein